MTDPAFLGKGLTAPTSPTTGGAELLVLPRLDVSKGRRRIKVSTGMNVAEMVALAFPPPSEFDPDNIRVVIGDDVIAPGVWHLVRPRAGATVIIRCIPGNDPLLRSVLTVAVLVASVALGNWAGPGVATTFFVSEQVGTAIATAGFPVGGSMLISLFRG